MTEVNVAQEVFAAGQKRARDFAALLGIEHPVLNAPMPVEAGVELVAAVSEAGGLGVLSAAGRTPVELSKTVAAIRARTNKPFAIHLELPAKPLNPQELDAAKMLAEGLAPLLSRSVFPTQQVQKVPKSTIFRESGAAHTLKRSLSGFLNSIPQLSWQRSAVSGNRRRMRCGMPAFSISQLPQRCMRLRCFVPHIVTPS